MKQHRVLQLVFRAVVARSSGRYCFVQQAGRGTQQGLLRDVKRWLCPCCSVNSLLFFLQRGKEELREATALLTAQQTSLEIIVNMCCSDGECCGQQCLGSRAVLTWGALFSLLFDTAVWCMFIDKRTAFLLLSDAQMHI